MESPSYLRNRERGGRGRALARRGFYVSPVWGPRRAGDRSLIGKRLRADGGRGGAPGRAAARKPAAAICILVGMTFAAAVTAARRAPGISRPRLLSFCAIAAGGGIAIAVMLASGTLTSDLIVLVPVGSMIIANAMNACAQAMERFRADVLAHVGQIEAGLSLGADPATTVAPYVQSAIYASLLPRLDMLKSLGFVWIPGVMAGMVVSGASPVYAGIFQFIIVAMILSASGIAGLVATLLMRAQAFSSAAQLKFRPGIAGADVHEKPVLAHHNV